MVGRRSAVVVVVVLVVVIAAAAEGEDLRHSTDGEPDCLLSFDVGHQC